MNNPIITICIPTTDERNSRLRELLQSIHDHTKNMRYRVLYYPNADGGWVKAVHNALEGIDGYVVLLGSDVIVEQDWLKNLWNVFIKAFPNGDGAAEPFNENHGSTLCNHPLAHSRTIKEYLHKGYIHNYSDNEFTDRLRAINKLIYVPEAKIQHNHVMNKKAQMDETYKIVLNPENFARDRELYSTRKAKNFHD
jgi:GT2 family glycosyltransferase